MSAVACLLLVLAPGVGDEEIVAAVNRFLLPFQEKKLEAAMAAWSAASPQLKAFRTSAEEALAYVSDPPRSGWEISEIAVKGDAARLILAFQGRWTKADEEYPDEEITAWSLELRKEAGAWTWWSQEPAALEMSRELATAKDAGARREILKRKPALVGIRLLLAMTEGGLELVMTKRAKEGMRLLEVAIETADASPHRHLQALAYTSWGQTMAVLGRPGEAVARLEKARDLWDAVDGAEGGAWARNSLGFAYADQGQPGRALEELRRAGEVAELMKLGDLRFEVAVTTLIALQKAGRSGDAEAQTARLLALAGDLKSPVAEARARDQIALARYERGDFGGAFDQSIAAQALLRGDEEPILRARLRNTEGLVYLATGDPEKAARRLDEARRIWSEIPLPRLSAVALQNLGEAKRRLGQVKEGEADLAAALAALKEIGDLPMAVFAQNNLGISLRLRGLFDQAEAQYLAGLEIAQGPAAAKGRFYLRSNLSELALARKDYPRALAFLDDVVRDAEASRSAEFRYLAYVGVGRVRAARKEQGDLEKAVDAFQRALAGLEDMRGGLRDPALRQGLMADHAPAYFLLAEVLLRLGRAPEAFAAVEKAKARTLVEILDSGGTGLVRSMTPQERADESRLQDAYAVSTLAVESARSADEREKTEAGLAEAREALEEFRRGVYARHPALQIARGRFAPAPLEELNRALAVDGRRCAVLSYLVGQDGILLLALAPGKERASLSAFTLDLEPEALRARVEAFWAACAVAGADEGGAARALYDDLVRPAAAALEGADHVVISADGFLHGLPFQALRAPGGEALIERWSVSYAPSATALLRMSDLASRPRAAGGAALLVVGDPEMPAGFGPLAAARREAESLAARAGVKALTGAEATEPKVRAAMAGARRIHLATHGRVDEAIPMSSFVVLAKGGTHDGFLQAREIADLDLQAELLVLSACETARGRHLRGEGVVGLTWAAFAAGVPATVVSQWQVADESTGDLMKAFYEALEDPKTPGAAAALRAAQLKILRDPKTRHPYYWAPFVLAGHPGR